MACPRPAFYRSHFHFVETVPTASFTLTVKNGHLALSNSKAASTFIIVR